MPAWTVIYSWAFWPLLTLVCAGCRRVRDRAVRQTAVAFGAAMAFDLLSRSWRAWASLEVAVAASDVALLAGLLVLTVRFPRPWLMVMTALQLVEVLGHLTRATHPMLSRLAYATLVGGGAYVQLILLSTGLLLAGRTHRSMDGRRA